MPIRPEPRPLYPEDWDEISRRIRFERAGGRCEWCGEENYRPQPGDGEPGCADGGARGVAGGLEERRMVAFVRKEER